MGTFGEDLGDLPMDSFDHSFFLFCIHLFHFLLDSGVHLRAIFCLLTDGDFEASVDKRLNVVLQVRLVKANDVLPLARRDAQVDEPVAFHRVLVIDDEPVAEAIEHNLIKVFRLNLPVSHHAGSKCVPLGLRDVNRAGVVVGMIWSALLFIEDVLRLGVPRTFLVLLYDTVHVLPRPALAVHLSSGAIIFTSIYSIILDQVVLSLRFTRLESIVTGDGKSSGNARGEGCTRSATRRLHVPTAQAPLNVFFFLT